MRDTKDDSYVRAAQRVGRSTRLAVTAPRNDPSRLDGHRPQGPEADLPGATRAGWRCHPAVASKAPIGRDALAQGGPRDREPATRAVINSAFRGLVKAKKAGEVLGLDGQRCPRGCSGTLQHLARLIARRSVDLPAARLDERVRGA